MEVNEKNEVRLVLSVFGYLLTMSRSDLAKYRMLQAIVMG